MSWQAYVDNLLASQKVDQAAIFSKAGDSVWAHSPNFNVSPAEISELAKGFDDPSGLQAKGLHIQGVKYFLLSANDRSIYGKKGASGIVAVRTKQTILIAHYPEGVQPGQVTTVVEGLADYLIQSQY